MSIVMNVFLLIYIINYTKKVLNYDDPNISFNKSSIDPNDVGEVSLNDNFLLFLEVQGVM